MEERERGEGSAFLCMSKVNPVGKWGETDKEEEGGEREIHHMILEMSALYKIIKKKESIECFFKDTK